MDNEEMKDITPTEENKLTEEQLAALGGVAIEDIWNYIDSRSRKKVEEDKEWTLGYRSWKETNKAMTYFEKVSRFANEDLPTPMRKTMYSAGYDMSVAEDIVVPPYPELLSTLQAIKGKEVEMVTLSDLANLTKATGAKPTLVSTGYKCRMTGDMHLELFIRSSGPLKYWLILANGTGIIDAR